MTFRNRIRSGNKTLQVIGLMTAVAGAIMCVNLHPSVHFGDGLVGGTIGLMYGISIGTLILSMRRKPANCG